MIAVLSLRKRHLGLADEGFTLIELLVVVIIIGVLAAIAIPVYFGIQANSKYSSVQNDLVNAKSAVISVQTSKGALPDSAADVATKVSAGDGYTRSSYTGAIKYTVASTGTPYLFCLSSTVSGGDGTKFFITDSGGVQKVSTTAPVTALPSGC